ncbi:capsular polysaccharide biosynthesis protein [Streptomyces sp. LBL]|uniref:lipopolysaccharide biosynthesis protein n=1 Tax=Streptomyces sp. LBL TaxID=2940562 RepID=UPI00247713D1|nr:lipopolysaccharide biosynthesis protein [Streptomyces sp. LBL]MDH6623502.1 capsular polysaccharide biosynthesis protein [Streptomyces sp. LBL]
MTDHSTRLRRLSLRTRRTVLSWSLLAACTLVGGALGGAYGVYRGPVYTATSYVVVVPTNPSDAGSALGFAQAYGRAATQLAVLLDAQAQAGVPVSTMQSNVRTSTSPDAPVVAVSATSPRPALASGMANGVTRALTRHANDTEENTHVRLVEFSQAVRPTVPTSASPVVTGAVGASAGGLLGGLLLLVRPRRPEKHALPPASVPGPAVAAELH